jgi:hypothetical protein
VKKPASSIDRHPASSSVIAGFEEAQDDERQRVQQCGLQLRLGVSIPLTEVRTSLRAHGLFCGVELPLERRNPTHHVGQKPLLRAALLWCEAPIEASGDPRATSLSTAAIPRFSAAVPSMSGTAGGGSSPWFAMPRPPSH